MNKPRYVVFVHYHLRGGGVTRVIEHAVESLERQGIKTSVVVGESPSETTLDNVLVHKKLAYNEVASSPSVLKDEIIHLCKEATGLTPDIWHFHNHNLGKNISSPQLVKELSDSGQPVVLQIHDFPEDGRPLNYRYLSKNLNVDDIGSIMYPLAGNVHYVTLNRRDKSFLLRTGMPVDQISVLPNIVHLPQSEDWKNQSKKIKELHSFEPFVLYPTRAIRRKNIGEFLLFSALGNNDTRFAITLSPNSPEEIVFYEKWVEFARGKKLPVLFELALKSNLPFIELMRSARYIMTTSITEGFGLTFLEPWLADKLLYGRNLPDITKDFADEGIDLSSLYDRIDIPLDLIDQKNVEKKIETGLKRTYEAYQRDFKSNYADQALKAAICDNRIDFGKLDEDDQQKVISKVLSSNVLKDSLSGRSPNISDQSDTIVRKNKKIIEEKYNEQVYAKRLLNIYDKLLQSGPDNKKSYISSKKILDQYLKPERFILLRS